MLGGSCRGLGLVLGQVSVRRVMSGVRVSVRARVSVRVGVRSGAHLWKDHTMHSKIGRAHV